MRHTFSPRGTSIKKEALSNTQPPPTHRHTHTDTTPSQPTDTVRLRTHHWKNQIRTVSISNKGGIFAKMACGSIQTLILKEVYWRRGRWEKSAQKQSRAKRSLVGWTRVKTNSYQMIKMQAGQCSHLRAVLDMKRGGRTTELSFVFFVCVPPPHVWLNRAAKRIRRETTATQLSWHTDSAKNISTLQHLCVKLGVSVACRRHGWFDSFFLDPALFGISSWCFAMHKQTNSARGVENRITKKKRITERITAPDSFGFPLKSTHAELFEHFRTWDSVVQNTTNELCLFYFIILDICLC